MKPLFARNLGNTGRLVSGLGAVGLLIGAGFGFFVSISSARPTKNGWWNPTENLQEMKAFIDLKTGIPK